MYEDYFIVDIETCPFDIEKYESLEEEEKSKLLNPIDSKIIGLGIRYKNENKLFIGENEREILNDFWNEWKKIKKENPNNIIVGFNINNFDLPFLTTRSFINEVEIVPFLLKLVVDLREKLNAYRYGKTRGKLSDYGNFLGMEISKLEGKDVFKLFKEKNWEKLKEHLISDLEITENILKRAKKTNIIHINKW